MIQTDLTEVLSRYCDWDNTVKEKHLQYAEKLIQQQTVVVYKGIEYRHIEDLKVDLDAESLEAETSKG